VTLTQQGKVRFWGLNGLGEVAALHEAVATATPPARSQRSELAFVAHGRPCWNPAAGLPGSSDQGKASWFDPPRALSTTSP
jgi:hypothetical protein